MDPFTVGIIGIVLLIILLILGLHVSIALGLIGIVGMMFIIDPEAAIYTSATLSYDRISNYSMMIIPLYVMMGVLGQESGLSKGAYEFLRLWTGRLRGGLGIATIGACTLFGTVCGSSLVTAAVFAQMSAPEMRRWGYDKKFAYGICSSGGVIGMLIPPSVLIVIYGLLTRDSIGRLLVAGISPGILLFVIFSLGIMFLVYLNPHLAGGYKHEKTTWIQRLKSLKLIWGVVLMVLIIFGGIFSGTFSPSEAGAVACVVLLVIFLFSKQRSWNGLKSAIYNTIAPSGMIFLLLIGAGIFTRFLVLSTVAPSFLNAIIAMELPNWGFLVGVVFVYLILGCFFDSISMLSITLPFLHPAALKLGIDPIHFAMVAIIAIEMGFITPPVGLNIYAVKGVAESDISLGDLFAGVLPFFIMMGICVLLFIGLPALSTWLPDLMFD